MPQRIQYPGLPNEILVSFEPIQIPRKGDDVAKMEIRSGSVLLKKMAESWLSVQNLQVDARKYEKPRAFIGEEEISVSFSHTDRAISAALSRQFIVGCDMESAGRNVHPRLLQRMRHPGENGRIYNNVEPIRIWTCKEAALKMIGTGLRKPMNGVKLEQATSSRFDVIFDDGRKAKLCSFRHKDYWISICYEE